MTTTLNNAAGERIAGPDRATAELLDVTTVAAMLDCSPRHVYRMADAGKLPRPLRLGSLVRWRAVELRAWIAGGCSAVRSVKGGGA